MGMVVKTAIHFPANYTYKCKNTTKYWYNPWKPVTFLFKHLSLSEKYTSAFIFQAVSAKGSLFHTWRCGQEEQYMRHRPLTHCVLSPPRL